MAAGVLRERHTRRLELCGFVAGGVELQADRGHQQVGPHVLLEGLGRDAGLQGEVVEGLLAAVLAGELLEALLDLCARQLDAVALGVAADEPVRARPARSWRRRARPEAHRGAVPARTARGRRRRRSRPGRPGTRWTPRPGRSRPARTGWTHPCRSRRAPARHTPGRWQSTHHVPPIGSRMTEPITSRVHATRAASITGAAPTVAGFGRGTRMVRVTGLTWVPG